MAKKVETITRETKNYEWNEKSKKINCVNKTQTYTTYNDCTNKCSGSCTTTGYQEITCSYQKCDTTSYWEVENNIPGRKNIHKIYGKYADGYSYIKTSRSLQATNQTSSSYLNLLFDACTVNKHCELENDNKTCRKDKNGNVIYQYYIGPNLDKAFLGTTKNNYYQLIGGCSKNPSGTSAVGVKHYYLADLVSCKNTCGTYITDFRSDDYLKCAENYCDAQVDFNLKGNARTRKKDCIISCGYSYGIGTDDNGNPSYTASNRESVNSCKNSSPYNGIKKVEVSANSQCSINSATGDNIYNTKGIITNCVGDQITDFDNDDTNDTIFDHRKYINVACKETSGFNFLDLTGKRYLAGQGIDYYTKLNGEKECTVYFNLEQWKFDYATISSKDPDRRKRLLYIYSVYNNALNDSYDKTKNPYYDPDFLSENDGEITWSEYEYDINKVNVISKVREIVNNLVKQSMNYNLVVNSKDESVNATVISKEEIKQIYNLNLNKQQVNRYLQTSKVNANYVFDKYCVTNDGKATVYKPNNGVCYVANGVDVLGKNVYYTDLNATPDKNFSETIKNQGQGHLVSTDVSVGEDRKEENEYYKDGESCPYKIDDESLGCSIVVKNNDGTEMHGNDIYVNGGVTANLKVNERLGIEDEVENVGITNGNTPVANGNKTISVNISDKRNGIETIEIVGIVESKKGKSAICRKKINIIDPSDSCGVSCSVNKDNNNYKLYEIKSTGKQKPNSYWTALSTNMRWVTVKPNISDGRYLVRLNNEIGNTLDGKGNIIYDETIVYGKVDGTMVTTGEKCSNVCWSETPKLPNCPKDYDPANTGAIKNYCERYWDKDVNNYVSVDDCISSCSNDRMCPEDKRDLKEVEKECSINYKEWGFSKTSNCVNYCYYCPDCSNDYIYRPVNNYNPFPFSSDSNTLGFNYQTGNRKVPSNWIGKTGYIKADDQDESSVTGANANQKVEYEIELTPSMIRDIRKDTESYNSGEGNDAYLDYVYMKGVDTTKRYYSKFINETFRSYFTTIDGTEV